MSRQAAESKVHEWGHLIGGEWRARGEPLEVRSPYNGSLVATTFWAPDEEVEQAVERARAAFPAAARLPGYKRAEVLRRMSQGVESRGEELARMLALEAGKPIKAARAEVSRAVFTLRDSAEEVQRIGHEFLSLDALPSAKGRWGIVRRFPVGPVLAITPFNFPVNLVSHKIGPALAAGCSMVLKPSPRTPITSLLLAEISQEAGVPAGALNVLNCTNEQTERLVADERLKMLTFTGSSAVGWRLKAMAGKKKVALELGGNAATIVHSDADLDLAAGRCAAGGFGYSGQSCISVQRILVHQPALDEFRSALADRAEALVVGDPLDEKTDVGPMITEEAAKRVESWVKEAVEGGAKLLAGGKREGSLIRPTVLSGTKPEMRVNCEEVFGPVVTVEPYDDFEKVLDAINDSPYGLQAGVFTQDVKRIFRAFESLEVGGVMANDISAYRVDHMPYGGVKASGAGREGARYAIEEMTEPRILVLNLES